MSKVWEEMQQWIREGMELGAEYVIIAKDGSEYNSDKYFPVNVMLGEDVEEVEENYGIKWNTYSIDEEFYREMTDEQKMQIKVVKHEKRVKRLQQKLNGMLMNENEIQCRAKEYLTSRTNSCMLDDMQFLRKQIDMSTCIIFPDSDKFHAHLVIPDFIDRNNKYEIIPRESSFFDGNKDEIFDGFEELVLNKVAATIIIAREFNYKLDFVGAENLILEKLLFAEVDLLDKSISIEEPDRIRIMQIIQHAKFMQSLAEHVQEKEKKEILTK